MIINNRETTVNSCQTTAKQALNNSQRTVQGCKHDICGRENLKSPQVFYFRIKAIQGEQLRSIFKGRDVGLTRVHLMDLWNLAGLMDPNKALRNLIDPHRPAMGPSWPSWTPPGDGACRGD